MTISDEILEEFKAEMSIYHSHEDKFLKRILERSYNFIKGKAGDFSLEDESAGKELVFNRARYDYNDSLEYFDKNFMTMVISFSLRNLPDLAPDEEETEEVTDDGSTNV